MKKLIAIMLTLCLCMTTCLAFAETTLKLGIYPEDVDTAAIESHETYISIFNETYPDVALERAQYKYATDTFVPLAEAGTLPTIFETWFTEPQKLIKGEFVADVTDQMEARGWLEKMNPSIRTLLSSDDGRLYGVPRDGYALGLMINVEVFEDAGLVDENGVPLYPKTWEELAEVSVKIKEATGSAGLCLLAKDNAGGWHFSNIAWCFGAVFQVQGEDGKWTAQLNTPEVVAAMEYVKDLKWKYDVLTSDPTSEDWGTGFTQLGTGAAAMYIAANDAVSQPTDNNGLAVDKLMMAGIPAGPAGAYSLFGGTPYMLSKTATAEEIDAALNYLEIMGKAPVLTETAKAGLAEDARYRKDNGIPVINEFPVWADDELVAARREVVAEYSNVDPALFDPYFDAVASEGNLKMEEPQITQDMYALLTNVLQAVVTDEAAAIQTLLDEADANFQTMLDEQINK
ncbi:MAG: extracellular solute-binding protein [Clostridiales bacterium]|nr:extracellular solute-binding protein [Clostridiales bacterium]